MHSFIAIWSMAGLDCSNLWIHPVINVVLPNKTFYPYYQNPRVLMSKKMKHFWIPNVAFPLLIICRHMQNPLPTCKRLILFSVWPGAGPFNIFSSTFNRNSLYLTVLCMQPPLHALFTVLVSVHTRYKTSVIHT